MIPHDIKDVSTYFNPEIYFQTRAKLLFWAQPHSQGNPATWLSQSSKYPQNKTCNNKSINLNIKICENPSESARETNQNHWVPSRRPERWQALKVEQWRVCKITSLIQHLKQALFQPWWRRWCRWLRRRWRRWSTLWNPGILKMTGHSFRLSITIVFLSPGNFLNKPGLLSFFPTSPRFTAVRRPRRQSLQKILQVTWHGGSSLEGNWSRAGVRVQS